MTGGGFKQRLGNRLAFLDHHPDGLVHGAALREAEIHDHPDDRDRQTEDRQKHNQHDRDRDPRHIIPGMIVRNDRYRNRT